MLQVWHVNCVIMSSCPEREKRRENFASAMQDAPLITITGFILGTDFNRRGKVIEIAIEANDFKKYIVQRDGRGGELYDKLLSTVTVYGTVIGTDSNDNSIICVTDYTIHK